MEVESCSKGEQQHDTAKFLKVNELRKASKSKESTIPDVDFIIKKLEEDLKKIVK